MFGNNITSSWANPQQNQQPQQPGTFGQPNAFGGSGASAFGQTQPQPQANPMFGNLGGGTSSGTAGFGAFGAPNANQSSVFGGAKPATGFGAFGGGPSAFGGGGGGAFGQPTTTPATGAGTTTGLFGQPATTSAFGGGSGGIFGANKPTPAFGSTSTGTGGSQSTALPVTTGSSNPPYTIHTEKDSPNTNLTLHYQSISCMPAYQNTSVEEIRLQDYAQGRKNAGAFGQSAAFGAAQPTTTNVFGAQPAQQNTPTPAFGSTTTGQGGFGAFGAPATTTAAPAATSTSIFGGGGFGQQQQQQQPQPAQGFGAFGAPAQQPQQQSGGLFGNAFGSNVPKPTGFGGFGGATGSSAFGGGSAFGQPTQQPQQQTQPTGGGLFGSTQPQAPASTGFGAAFGGSGANKSIFGGQTSNQPTTGFGSFGNTQPQTQQQPPQQTSLFGGGGLFGGTTQPQSQNTQQPAPTSLFGGGATAGQTTGTGLFGGGGLFGSTTGQQQQQQPTQQQPSQPGGFGLFGANKPAAPAGSLFGGGLSQQPATAAPQQGLFGGSMLGQTNPSQSTLGGGLFGSKPAAPALGGSMSTGQGGLFGGGPPGIFGASTTNAGVQGTLTASIAQPIGSDLAIFDMLPPGPRLLNLEESQNKKKSGFFVDVPTRSPVPRVQLSYTPANSKLRGFGSSISALNGNLSFTSGTSNALSLSRIGDNKSVDGFLPLRSSSPSLGSGGKPSVKKVIMDKKIEPTELFTKSGGSPGLRGGKVVFSPALSIAAREKDAAAALNASANGRTESPTPAPRPQRTANRFTAESTQHLATDGQEQGTGELEDGDYWVKPDLATLKQVGYEQLSSFDDLSVGRVGYGEIQFLEPVDLTGLSKLGALLGEIVRFDDKECSVYPDNEEVEKPAPGSGLNVRARMSLYRCWAVDKATREPIKDAAHPSAVKHLKRLKNMKDTHFESFDITEGKWTFSVDHF